MTTMKQASKIERRLRVHNRLTEIYISEGWTKDKASKLAYLLIKNENRILRAFKELD